MYISILLLLDAYVNVLMIQSTIFYYFMIYIKSLISFNDIRKSDNLMIARLYTFSVIHFLLFF